MDKVFIVHSDIKVIHDISSYLKGDTCEIEAIFDVIQCLNKLKQDQPSLILCDHFIPGGGRRSIDNFINITPHLFKSNVISFSSEPAKIEEYVNRGGKEKIYRWPQQSKEFIAAAARCLRDSPATPTPEEKKHTILVIEDEHEMREILCLRLQVNGFNTLEASTGMDGLNTAKKQNPDIILLDIMLPDMDGYQVCRLLKFDKKYQHIPIIMLSALSRKEDMQWGEETGVNAYFTKPYDINKLLAKIHELLSS